MSEIREKLIGPKNVRSQIIQVAVLSVVLIFAFAFSTLLINILFGSLRDVPSQRLDDAEFKYLDTTPIPIPFDLDDLLAFFQSLGLEVTPEMIETLLDMFDGNFDGIPLDELAALMAALLYSEVEVFRVYNYTNFYDMEDYLWKYECYDQYLSGTWSASLGENNYDFYTYGEYYANPDLNPEILYIKMLNMTPDAGQNQFTIPALFSTPYLMKNSVDANNIDYNSLILRRQIDIDYLDVILENQIEGLNGIALRADFTASSNTNLTYNLVGDDLPPDAELDADCEIVSSPDPDYTAFIDDYSQMDGGDMATFISNHQDFATHYNYLDNNVINSGDNAFIIADKIRNYLQYNFNFSYNPVPDTEQDGDPINWFCKSQEGIYPEFASTFVALTRAFGVASRFVDGFNSRFGEQVYDPIENDFGFAVKYKNMYSWAEIFIPTDNTGLTGYWAQIDVLFENYMANPPEPIFGNGTYSLNVKCNGFDYDDYPIINSGETVIINATLTNASLPVENEIITFTDVTTGLFLGWNFTDDYGVATINVPVVSSMVAGPHVIAAEYIPQVFGFGNYILNKSISVNLTSVTPSAINVSDPTNNTIRVQGQVYDTLTSVGVSYSNVYLTLLENVTSIPNAFIPPVITTDEYGYFDAFIQGDAVTIPSGDYDVRADIYGTYNYTIMWYGVPIDLPPINPYFPFNPSQTRPLHVDKELTATIWFGIDSYPSNYPNPPFFSYPSRVVPRGSTLLLEARVFDELGDPLPNVTVSFYNYTGGDILINSSKTNGLGIATTNAFVGNDCVVGPNLLYAKVGNIYNYSYYILYESPNITVVSGPDPLVINKSNLETFDIVGYLNDTTNSAPLIYSDVELRLFRNSIDYTDFLITTGNNPFSVDNNGKFDVTFRVNTLISPGNYTLRLYFNGTFDLTSYPNYPYDFNLPYINTTVILDQQLQVTYAAPTSLNFWIDGYDSYQWELPTINRFEDLNLTTLLLLGTIPLSGKQIQFVDITQDDLIIGTAYTDSYGFANFIYETNSSTIAGAHLIYARYAGYYNYSYFVLDAPINITINSGPSPSIVNCTTSFDRTFTIDGTLLDLQNGAPIKYGSISVHLFSGTSELTPITNYLNLIGGNTDLDSSGTFSLQYYVLSALTQGNYSLKLYFNGTFLYSAPNNDYNQHNFYMDYLFNFSYSADLLTNLTVYDPDDVQIYLSVENNATTFLMGGYDDGYPPESFKEGEVIHLQIRVSQSESWVNTGTVYVYDDIDSGPYLGSYSFTGGESTPGMALINISTTGFHSGLYRFLVQYGSFEAINKTYIVINESITINPSFTYLEVQRGVVVAQSLTADITSGGSGTIEGLRINLTMLDSNYIDVTALYLDLQGSQPITVFNNQGVFTINSIFGTCPQGLYYLRIDFNGSLIDSWLDLSNFMNSITSTLITLNVTADTYLFNGSYYTVDLPSEWYQTDTLHIIGTLRWDNNTGIQFANVTIQITNGTDIFYQNTTITLIDGSFDHVTTVTDWPNDVEIWIYYYPTDPNNFGTPEGYYIDLVSQEIFRIIP